MSTTYDDPRESAHLRRRVRIYLQVVLSIDLFAHVSDVVSPLLFDDFEPPEAPLYWTMRVVNTALMLGAWLIARFTRPRRSVLVALEAVTTLGLSLSYVVISNTYFAQSGVPFGPAFGLVGIILLLVVRAALVPSRTLQTAAVGLAAIATLLVVARDWLAGLDQIVAEGVVFMAGAFVLATTVTSRVIYGLRREVRHALQLGQYTLGEALGEGGMGTVYRATHAMLQRDAAIKLIKPAPGADPSQLARARARFEREAHVTAHLCSPHTVQLYDFGVSDDGAFYYVMELLDGVDLDTAVQRFGPMPPERVAYLLRQACDSLAEAHAAGLVHRDIKPANLFVCRYGLHLDFVKVLDFGLVTVGPRPDEDNPNLTAEGFAAGTPAYLAPEAVAAPGTLDHRADIYALGCVAYWLLTGQAPFVRDTAMATLLAHVNDPPTPPSEACELALPAALEELVLACLAKDPSARPATAAELSERLTAAVADLRPWDEARAARWWETHRPAAAVAPPSPAHGAALTVTKLAPSS